MSGGTTDSFTYDNNGSQTAASGKSFTYNNAGRMSDYSDSTNNFSYLINSMGQRVKKIDNNNASNNVWYVYNEAGQLITEYDNSGSVINEYIYINGAPIALLRSSNLYYIYPDHLGTPRTITDTSNNPVWTWENTDPFGNNSPNDTVSGSTFTFNLRLPGQYFDNESKLNYNYFRNYNSMLGRYIQSDPIGLSGGINTFGYVGGNSLSGVDIFGLLTSLVVLRDPAGINHVGLMINSNIYSLYAGTVSSMLGINGPGDIAIHTKKEWKIKYKSELFKMTLTQIDLKINDTQEKYLDNYLRSRYYASGRGLQKYSLIGNTEQCTVMAAGALSKIGLNIGNPYYPEELENEVIRNNKNMIEKITKVEIGNW